MLCCLFGGDRLKHVGGDRFVVYYNTDHKISKPVQLLLFLFCCFQYLFAEKELYLRKIYHQRQILQEIHTLLQLTTAPCIGHLAQQGTSA